MLVQAYQTLLGIQIDLSKAVDSKDLYDSLSTHRHATETYIRPDVNLIRYGFATKKAARIIWIFGCLNLADLLTKTDSPLGNSLQLMMFSGKPPFDFAKLQHCDREKCLGKSSFSEGIFDNLPAESKFSWQPWENWRVMLKFFSGREGH